MATTKFYPDAHPESTSVDGFVKNNSSKTWDTVHDATTGTFDSEGAGGYVFMRRNSSNTDIRKWFFLIDTSSLGTDTISSATFNVQAGNDQRSGHSNTIKAVHLVQTSPASNTELSTNDFDQCGATDNPTEGSDSPVTIASMSNNTYFQYILNATGIGWIDKNGITKLGLRSTWDVTDTEPAEENSTGSGTNIIPQEFSGNTAGPYLEVVHVAGAAGFAFSQSIVL